MLLDGIIMGRVLTSNSTSYLPLLCRLINVADTVRPSHVTDTRSPMHRTLLFTAAMFQKCTILHHFTTRHDFQERLKKGKAPSAWELFKMALSNVGEEALVGETFLFRLFRLKGIRRFSLKLYALFRRTLHGGVIVCSSILSTSCYWRQRL